MNNCKIIERSFVSPIKAGLALKRNGGTKGQRFCENHQNWYGDDTRQTKKLSELYCYDIHNTGIVLVAILSGIARYREGSKRAS